jgi:hypothetical protein
MVGEIAIWFLVLGLIFPRITLLIAWFSHGIPANNIPFIGDFFMAVFVPRVLILIYIATNMGICPWFWIHLVFLAIVWIFNGIRVVSNANKSK